MNKALAILDGICAPSAGLRGKAGRRAVNTAVAVLVLACSLILPAAVSAGVVGSPHDIAAQGYTRLDDKDKMKGSVCNYCHVPHKAKGARLWATTPASLKGWGEVGPLCYSCHDGVAIVSPNVDASNTAFNPKSHGLTMSELPEGDDATDSGLPYTGGAADQNIECSTCHNPHDNTNRPFIRANINELCEKCHKSRENSGYGVNNAEGTHPVHKLGLDEVAGPSPIDVQAAFKTPFPQEYPSDGGKDAQGVHWTIGGHLSTNGDEGTIECVTCHSVHGRERVGPPVDTLLSMDPVKETADEFCEGCHRGKRMDGLSEPPYPNPGGTPYYHAADNDSRNGEGRIVEIVEPEGWQFGAGGELLCSTCHKPHGALPNSPMLRPMEKSKTFCEECHSVPFNHHPSGDNGGLADPSSGKLLARTREVIIPDDFPFGYTYGEPGNGQLFCSSCHGAHNVNCLLLISAECVEGQLDCNLCLRCHPKFNPTWQTNDDYKATHFMGDPMATYIDTVDLTTGQIDQVDGQPGYYDQYPPTNKEAWPESNLKSKYGTESEYDVTCCSCHNFAPGNLTGGDADDTPYNSGEPTVAQNYIETDLTSGLLARAGQYKEWLESDVKVEQVGGNRGSVSKVDKYLCTGCHGLTPNTNPDAKGEGMTHPLMDADGTSMTPVDGTEFTYNEHVNCETCHKVHEADSRGGFYILREVELRNANTTSVQAATANPYVIKKKTEIEYAPLCHRCHIDY